MQEPLEFNNPMKTQFYILLSLKTQQGFVDFGQYFFGNDREAAYELFGQLKGSATIKDTCLLHIDLMETVDELPVKIKTICCTLEELGCNCKLIARDLPFKEPGGIGLIPFKLFKTCRNNAKAYICIASASPAGLFFYAKGIEMNPMNVSQMAELGTAVARLIKNELATDGTVHAAANQVIVSISRFEVEHRLGNLLQQIYRAVDQHFPVRKEHLSLIIRDMDGSYENSFKIWKSA